MKKVMICAGGTGGHIIPGLSIAAALKEQDFEIHWMGSRQGLEATLVPKANLPIHYVGVRAIRGKGIVAKLCSMAKLLKAVLQAIKITRKVKPDLVICMGGFASGPGGIAAWLLKKPLLVHEQNSIAGSTNKILNQYATRTLTAFPNTFKDSVVVGNPVNQLFNDFNAPTLSDKQQTNILIVGGSRGAQALNEIVPKALDSITDISIRHQTGEALFDGVKASYGGSAMVTPFIDNMIEAYRWADIVICRAGAMTVFEVMAAGVAAIFIPYPHAVDDHQTANANYLVEKQAGLLLSQENLSVESLRSMVESLLEGPEKRLKLASNAFALRNLESLKQFTSQCLELLNGK